ncbi:MAG: PKD domain-containing protein [Thermoplasmata archaeon]
MKKKISSFLVFAMLVAATVPVLGLSGGAGDEPKDVPSEMLIWEGYAKGLVYVVQLDDATFKVKNFADVRVRIDDYVQLLSPHPFDMPMTTTQDGALTLLTIAPRSEVSFNYGDPRWIELPPPLWWCTEEYQAVRGEVPITLGGEILPYALQDKISLNRSLTQDAIWVHQEYNPVVVIGKTPLWKEIPEDQATEVAVKLAVTNTGFKDANSILVIDVLPPGYSYDPAGFSPNPDSIQVDGSGNTIFKWHISLDAAVWSDPTLEEPTEYDYEFIRYLMKTPNLDEGRYFLPRAYVDQNNDGVNDAYSAKPLLEVFHVNDPPVADAGGPYVGQEGTTLTLDASGSSDPDGDALQYRWDIDSDGTWDTAWSSDPTLDIEMGDNAVGIAKVEVSDGEESSVAFASYDITNVAPSLALTVLPSSDEGEDLTFKVQATDPGSDDLLYAWWGHCNGWSSVPILYPNDPLVVPDPYPSLEVNPRDVTDTQVVVCGDDGTFMFSVEVKDDDGGLASLDGSFQVDNLPPSLTVSPLSLLQTDEGISVTLDATASDEGSDDLVFTWDWELGPTITNIYYNDGVGPDPPESPHGTYPFTASDSSTHTYGDDCLCNVSLTVADDDGGVVTYTTTVEVSNVQPALVSSIQAYARGSLTLRIAGEKWHDVELRLYDGDVGVAVASIVRMPGNPDEQSVTLEDVIIDLIEGNFWAVVEYTPLDDPINGQLWGADPAWLIFTPAGGGNESRLHHTFNVRHPETWVWTVADFSALMVGVDITFEASASDPGSDDLTFDWDWGDGWSASTIYYNDGVGPDVYPSPNVNPMAVTDVTTHSFDLAGSYTITLTVTDDDGTATSVSTDLQIG